MHELNKYQSEAAENLIWITFYYYGHSITAVVDTGSEINIINSTIATKQISLPMNTHNITIMANINRGEGYLKSFITAVLLTCRAVKTVCDMFVGDTVFFDLLLECPW